MVVRVVWRRVVERFLHHHVVQIRRLRRLLLVVASDDLTTAVLVVRVHEAFLNSGSQIVAARGERRATTTCYKECIILCAALWLTKNKVVATDIPRLGDRFLRELLQFRHHRQHGICNRKNTNSRMVIDKI